jgi:hypothetical protein
MSSAALSDFLEQNKSINDLKIKNTDLKRQLTLYEQKLSTLKLTTYKERKLAERTIA